MLSELNSTFDFYLQNRLPSWCQTCFDGNFKCSHNIRASTILRVLLNFCMDTITIKNVFSIKRKRKKIEDFILNLNFKSVNETTRTYFIL